MPFIKTVLSFVVAHFVIRGIERARVGRFRVRSLVRGAFLHCKLGYLSIRHKWVARRMGSGRPKI